MLPVYLCDDDATFRNHLKSLVDSYILMNDTMFKLEGEFEAPSALLNQLDSKSQRSVYFLDVDLKDAFYDGFKLAKEIRKRDSRGFIIFITSHGELAFETFKYRIEALDYIDKSMMNTLSQSVEACFKSIQDLVLLETDTSQAYYEIVSGQKHYLFAHRDIISIETSSQKHRLILHTATSQLEYFGSLSEVLDQLSEDFIRTHRSYVINKKHIVEIDRKNRTILLSDQSNIPISRGMVKEFKNLNFQ